jgi:hypothetical protein
MKELIQISVPMVPTLFYERICSKLTRSKDRGALDKIAINLPWQGSPSVLQELKQGSFEFFKFQF